MSKKRLTVVQSFVYVSQLGITLITPVIGCTAAAVWLVDRYLLSSGLILMGILLGLGASAMSFIKFAKLVQCSAEREDKYDPK